MGGVGWGVQEAVAVLPTVVRVGLTERLQLSKDLQEMEKSATEPILQEAMSLERNEHSRVGPEHGDTFRPL